MQGLDYLKAIEEEYLIGLTNKGTVKRAIKDLEKTEIQWEKTEKGMLLKMEDIECQLVWPLGESTCSCPSRNICKHIILGVLFLKEQFLGKEEEKQEEKTEILPLGKEAFPSISEYPISKLSRILGVKRYKQIANQLLKGTFPGITQAPSVVTVIFEKEEITVKLLEPMEHSACSCHKKDICIHKAEAILSCQVFWGCVTKEILEETKAEAEAIDYEELHRVANSFQNFLMECFTIGLARSSPFVPESMERLSILAHNAGLADFERNFRELAEEYLTYFKRNVTFSPAQLMKKLTDVFLKSKKLSLVNTKEALSEIAGEFKSSYEETDTMHLLAFGSRNFNSKSGYEGTIVYLLEIKKMEWFTFTKAKPTFYEEEKGRRAGNSAYASSPFGLFCPFSEFSRKEFLLYHPRVNRNNRISSSEKSRGELLGDSSLRKYDLSKFWYDDFYEIFDRCLAKGQEEEQERLIFVEADRMEESVYNEKTQTYSLPLYDKKNRKLVISVRFSKEEKPVIQTLERMEKEREEKQSNSIPIFLGIVFLKEGQLSLYPIEMWKDGDYI